MTRARLRCAACDRPVKHSTFRLCSGGCGARLCRARHIPHCSDLHAGQCPNFQPLEPPMSISPDPIAAADILNVADSIDLLAADAAIEDVFAPPPDSRQTRVNDTAIRLLEENGDPVKAEAARITRHILRVYAAGGER